MSVCVWSSPNMSIKSIYAEHSSIQYVAHVRKCGGTMNRLVSGYFIDITSLVANRFFSTPSGSKVGDRFQANPTQWIPG